MSLTNTKLVSSLVALALGSQVAFAETDTERYSIRSTAGEKLQAVSAKSGNFMQQLSARQAQVQFQLQEIDKQASQLDFTINKRLSTLAPIAFAELTAAQAHALRLSGFEVHKSSKMYLVEDEYQSSTSQMADSMPWGISKVGADQVWQTTTGDSAKVCVVDGGMDIDHYDLSSNYINGKSLDRQNNTVDDDENSHGTHVAGSIAALKNDTGVVGIAPDADLYIADVFDSNGSAYTDDILQGVDWCVSQGAQVINMSYGGSSSDSNQESTYQAAYDAGVVMVAASGNAGSSNLPIYPARYSTTIAVNGTNSNDGIYSSGQQGPQIDIAAPGVSITSTTINGNTGQKTGTSMAAPHVTGAVALLLDVKPSLSVEEVRSALRETAVDLGSPGHDNAYGAGRLDVKAAVDYVSDDDPKEPTEPSADFTYTNNGSLNVSFSDASDAGTDKDGNPIEITEWNWDFGDRTESNEQNPSHTYSAEGSYRVALSITDADGNSDTFSQDITVEDVEPPKEDEIRDGDTKTVDLAKGEWAYYYFSATAADMEKLVFTTSGGSGDADLYVQYDVKPDLNSSDCRSESPSSNENCTVNNVQQGRYYVGVYAYSAINGVSLSLEVSEGGNDTCENLDEWNSSTQYSPGQRVSYRGVEYNALWWNSNSNPEQNHGTGWFDDWEKIGPCQ